MKQIILVLNLACLLSVLFLDAEAQHPRRQTRSQQWSAQPQQNAKQPTSVTTQQRDTYSAQVKRIKTLAATVTDVKGESTIVTELEGKYQSSVEYQGGRIVARPSIRTQPVLSFILYMKEGHISWEEKFDLPFSDIREVRFEDWYTGAIPYAPKRTTIEKRDGSIITIISTPINSIVKGPRTYEEGDSGGQVKKELKFERFGFTWVSFHLEGFEGKAKTSTGIEGKFYLECTNVKRIMFN